MEPKDKSKLAAALSAGIILAVTVGTWVYGAGMSLTPQLRAEYVARWQGMKIRPDKANYVKARVDRISHFIPQYTAVSKATGVPWHVVAVMDELEGGGGAATHLHNGDSLKRKTVNVPAGRPNHPPPYTFYDSALDALKYDGFTDWDDWSLSGTLYKLEGYNGWGYRSKSRNIPSPYLWSFATPPYSRGKFIADGRYDPNAVSAQVGAAVLLKRMEELKLIKLEVR